MVFQEASFHLDSCETAKGRGIANKSLDNIIRLWSNVSVLILSSFPSGSVHELNGLLTLLT
jgi:hypothetical protein